MKISLPLEIKLIIANYLNDPYLIGKHLGFDTRILITKDKIKKSINPWNQRCAQLNSLLRNHRFLHLNPWVMDDLCEECRIISNKPLPVQTGTLLDLVRMGHDDLFLIERKDSSNNIHDDVCNCKQLQRWYLEKYKPWILENPPETY